MSANQTIEKHTCEVCAKEFERGQNEEWKRKCLACWKQGRPKTGAQIRQSKRMKDRWGEKKAKQCINQFEEWCANHPQATNEECKNALMGEFHKAKIALDYLVAEMGTSIEGYLRRRRKRSN